MTQLKINIFPPLAPSDYQQVDASFTIPAGGTYQSILLTITSDAMTENPEDLRVVLSNPSFGAVIVNPIAVVYIIDTNCKLHFG